MLSSLSLMLAVTTICQATAAPAPTPPPRAHRRARPSAFAFALPQADIQELAAQAPVLAMSAQDLQASAVMSAQELRASAANLAAMAQPDISWLSAHAPTLAFVAQDLKASAMALTAGPLTSVWDHDDQAELTEPKWQDQSQADVADSLYRAARQALNDNSYERAADLFRSIRDRYPRSTYVPNTYYWQAFALYRTGAEDNLRAARDALRTQASRYPQATTKRDAAVLLRRVQGALARIGDSQAAEEVTAEAESIAPAAPAIAAIPPVGSVPAIAGAPGRRYTLHGGSSCDDDDDDLRIAALNAVLQMDPDRAVPLLKTVLARRDDGSVCMRRKAVFLLSQKRTSETSSLLLRIVREDPDREVREQAVFWLSQVPGDETAVALDSVLRDPKTDPEIQDKAIFALSQHRSSRAAATLRDFAGRRDVSSDLREKAIFWIGQSRSPENAQFLKDLFAKVENEDLKDKIIFSLSQMGGSDNYRWLMDIALNPKEDIDIRKKALFWAGQGHSVDVADLVRLYDNMSDREMKEQLIFVYSQRREEAALDKLFQIGKNDPDRELRKKAIFWVGQSRSPRAAQYLQELINQ